MQKDLIRKVEIETQTKDECMRIGTLIHDQLRGNQDYIDSNILLNCTDSDNVVRLYIFEECENIPSITI